MTRALLLLCLVALSACGITPYQRFMDYADTAKADLQSSAMHDQICRAGADTPECHLEAQQQERHQIIYGRY